jgi:hypothetical protein
MSSSPHVFAITVTSGERAQLLRLVERHGTPAQQAHLGHRVTAAPDLGSVSALAKTVDVPGRQPGSWS